MWLGILPAEDSCGFSPDPGDTHVCWHRNFSTELLGLGVSVCDCGGKCV